MMFSGVLRLVELLDLYSQDLVSLLAGFADWSQDSLEPGVEELELRGGGVGSCWLQGIYSPP